MALEYIFGDVPGPLRNIIPIFGRKNNKMAEPQNDDDFSHMWGAKVSKETDIARDELKAIILKGMSIFFQVSLIFNEFGYSGTPRPPRFPPRGGVGSRMGNHY